MIAHHHLNQSLGPSGECLLSSCSDGWSEIAGLAVYIEQ